VDADEPFHGSILLGRRLEQIFVSMEWKVSGSFVAISASVPGLPPAGWCNVRRMRLPVLLTLPVALACGAPSQVTGGPFQGDPANFTYELDGKPVSLKNGMHEVKTGNGVDDVVATDLTGARSDADFDGDGTTDAAVVITQDEGPMKVHYLAVLVGGGSKALTARLGKNVLVERLSPHPKGGVLVTMLGRDDGVPEDTPPKLPIEHRFVIQGGALAPAK
jgi:hypothetical protein